MSTGNVSELADFRSDTVTRPGPAMIEAMFAAPVGDDVYGEDPSVLALETAVAELLGMEAALFTPSGTMANQIAIACHTRPGDTVLAEDGAHCTVYEAGAASALSGVQVDLLDRALRLAPEAVTARMRQDSLHTSPTSLLVIENTHNLGGGRVLTPGEVCAAANAAHAVGAAVHGDGARLWNAAVALGIPESSFTRHMDSVAVCFSKGLGAPVGSALVGTRAFIDRARKFRKRFGGGMRQAGYLAAAALFAVTQNRARLAKDHLRAASIAQALGALADFPNPVSVNYPDPGTNMVYFRFAAGDNARHVAEMAGNGVVLNALVGGWMRAVTHLDINDSHCERLIACVRAIAARHP